MQTIQREHKILEQPADEGFSASQDSAADAEAELTKLIAFYLPQFHPIPENDLWWGRGFTEWTNVAKATPMYTGHYQPHLPADFGYYDLRVRETRMAQIAMAKQYGVYGFCYYYYWFSGKRLLERPLDDMLADKDSDMPFCLCWANESWTRRWDGADQEILIEQLYRPDDDLAFIKSVEPFLRDPRYIHHRGGPLLIVYCPQRLPDSKRSAQVWREYCESVGIKNLRIFAALTHNNWDHTQFGFDGAVEFPPHNLLIPEYSGQLDRDQKFRGAVFDVVDLGEQYLNRDYPGQDVFRGVLPSWDNTARRKTTATIMMNGDPDNFEYWLSRAIELTRRDYPGEERFVFINAWNEWAEGCHLEPDVKHGHAFLDVLARVKRGKSRVTDWARRGAPNASKQTLLSRVRRALGRWIG